MADTFQIILLLRAEEPLAKELTATGWPLYRATNFADAARTAQNGGSFIFTAAKDFAQAPTAALQELERASQVRHLKMFVLQGDAAKLPAYAEALSAQDRAKQDVINELAPKMLANQRAAPRATVSMAATFVDEKSISGTVTTLSEGGVSFAAQECPVLGETGRLTVQVSPNEKFEVLATVVNERRMDKIVGLRFAGASPELLASLRKWVSLALGGAAPTSETRRLLMLEPSVLAQKTHAAIFATAGFETSLAAHPGQALKACAQQKHDAILCEPQMPELAGDRLKELVRQVAPVPVILLTSAANAKSIQEKTGAYAVLPKGLYADMLVIRLNALLAKR